MAQSRMGSGRYQVTQSGGRRCSTAVGYLRPATSRPNLTVETFLQVHRVLFEGDRAVGVQAERTGELKEVRAEREVILCGGAYNSPQLLMLSGVGSAELLTMLQIPVVADLPAVGQNLQDHAASGWLWTHDEPVSLLSAMSDENMARFESEGSGPLTSNAVETGGFLRSSEVLSAPDLQFHVAGAMLLDEPIYEHGLTIGVYPAKPASRGMLTLRSPDPTVAPFILHNYYAEDSDMQAAMRGLRFATEIAAQPALAPYTVRPYDQPESDSGTGSAGLPPSTDLYGVSSRRHLPDGLGRRGRSGHGAACARRSRTTGNRRVGDAECRSRQYERPDDCDRRAGQRT